MRSPARPRLTLAGLPPRIALGFGAAIASVVVSGAFSWFALQARTEAAEEVAHAAASQLALEEVESALLVAHTAVDAYLGTRDPRHRARVERATGKLDAGVRALAPLVGNEPAELQTLARLVPAVEAARAEHAAALALADRGSFEEALAMRRRDVGGAALERGKEVIEELEGHEARELQRHALSRARVVATSNVVFGVANVALLVLIALAARLVRSDLRRREVEEAARAQALAVQQRLMAVVSHDLRNPLTGILAAGWSLSRAATAEDVALLARRIVAAGRRMERLIRDLLDWSRLHGGVGIPISPRAADLRDVCRRVADELSEGRGERLRLEGEGDTCAVFDPDRVEQIVANLVANALKYAPPETPVVVRAVGEGDEVRVEVRDAGPGLPPEVQEGLFEPFRRGGGASREDGASLGLGLFIVRTLADAIGARVELDSGPDRGTTFAVRLRRQPPDPTPQAWSRPARAG
jgi:signal transduction histidine kinase